MSGAEPDIRRPVGLDRLIGSRFLELTGDRVVMELEIRSEHHQPFGIVHGGVYCSLVESSASMGAAAWYGDRGRVVGVANQTDFIRAVERGTVTAVAEPIHRGRTTQLWEVCIRDQADRLVAKGQVRIANLDQASSTSTGM